MTRRLVFALSAAAALCACSSSPSAPKCSQNADCPANSICSSGVCQQGIPSGGSTATVAGAGHLTAGTMTMDATIGQPVVPSGTSGTRSMKPAENTR